MNMEKNTIQRSLYCEDCEISKPASIQEPFCDVCDYVTNFDEAKKMFGFDRRFNRN